MQENFHEKLKQNITRDYNNLLKINDLQSAESKKKFTENLALISQDLIYLDKLRKSKSLLFDIENDYNFVLFQMDNLEKDAVNSGVGLSYNENLKKNIGYLRRFIFESTNDTIFFITSDHGSIL